MKKTGATSHRWKRAIALAVSLMLTLNNYVPVKAGNNEWYYKVKYDESGKAHLISPSGEDIAGPYSYIEDERSFSWSFPCRYIGLNGLYGYLNGSGKEITPPIFTGAGEFVDGKAKVSEDGTSIYYIDREGNRLTRNYCEGSDFETQGWYARVLLDDGSWGIINAWDRLVFSGADHIDELPYVTTVGCCVVDGRAVLFNLCPAPDEEEFRIIREYESFCDIKMVYAEYGVVKNLKGLYGVVNYTGELVIPDIYVSIEYSVIDTIDSAQGEVLFLLEKTDGTYETRIEPAW